MLVLALKLSRNIATSESVPTRDACLRRHCSQRIASGRGLVSFRTRDDSLVFPEGSPYGWAILRF
jgi:hypothetical protein